MALNIEYIDPNHGSMNGGTEITLHGSGFTDVKSIIVGKTTINQFIVKSDNEISFTSLPHSTGWVQVFVITDDIKSNITKYLFDGNISYATVMANSNGNCPLAGGNVLSFYGENNLKDVKAILFGKQVIRNFQFENGRIIYTVPPGNSPGENIEILLITDNETSFPWSYQYGN